MKKVLFPLTMLALLLTSCGGTNSSSESSSSTPEAPAINDLELNVYGTNNEISFVDKKEGETFQYSFEGNNIRIENDKVIALKGNTETEVQYTSSLSRSGSFKVKVLNREYVSTHKTAEESEGWFNKVSVNKVTKMTASFANGMDISSAKQLYDNGQKFYNADGVEQSLFYILKDAGVNWVRLRLWVDPKDTWTEGGETKTYLYGGGNCHLDNVTWMAHEAKAAGLKILLDFHYSDFWTDPTNQIVPKAWVNISTVSAMAAQIKSYTKESLLHLKENGALPDMVALGNETYAGMLFHNPGPITTVSTGKGPLYSTEHTERNAEGAIGKGTEGRWNFTTDKSSNYNIRTYFNAAARAVKEVDPNILTSLHFVKGFSDPTTSIKFFTTFDDLDIDVYSLSAYAYYHFTHISTLRNGLTEIANAFPNKKIAIAETSYGFTFETDTWASNIFKPSGDESPVPGYEANIQGQASLIRDMSEVVANLNNGFGVFYWEGAWTPTKRCGWADHNSKVSWANQAFFSYNGKALGSLGLYNQMLGK